MITTATAAFVVESGSQRKFDGANIICEPTFLELSDVFRVYMRIQDSATTEYIGEGYLSVTATEVDAETGTGTGETDPWFNALQKAVITKLSAYTGNGSTVFTIV